MLLTSIFLSVMCPYDEPCQIFMNWVIWLNVYHMAHQILALLCDFAYTEW